MVSSGQSERDIDGHAFVFATFCWMDRVTTAKLETRKSRILVIAENEGLLKAIHKGLEERDFEVFCVRDSAGALPLEVSLSADLVLLDLQADNRRTLDLCRRIKSTAQGKRLPLVLLADLCKSNDVIAGLTAGADCFLAKPVDPSVLAAKLRALLRFAHAKEERHASSYSLPELVAQRVADLCVQAKVSARERQVLDLLLLGRSNEEMAQVLGFKARTAKFHQVNVLKKLGADSRADLLRILL